MVELDNVSKNLYDLILRDSTKFAIVLWVAAIFFFNREALL